MRMKFIKLLVSLSAVSLVAVLGFYGWILSHQYRRPTPQSHQGRFFGGGPDIQLRDLSAGKESEPQYDVNRALFVGHTLKPFRKVEPVMMHIPPVPEFSQSDNVEPLDESVMKKYQSYEKKKAKESVLILTPIHDVEKHLKTFQNLLQSLTYPHRLITVAFGEDSSHDHTLSRAHDVAAELKKSFAGVNVFHFRLTGQINGSWSTIHSKENQLVRRHHLAQARNSLLRAARKTEDWVLWIDSDVSSFPPDVVQQLLSAEKEIVAPLCIYMDSNKKRVYDKNTWRETNASLAYQKSLPRDFLVVEGYDKTKRLWLSDLRAEGRVVPIDGVGGCMLLVKASCHENGLIFPEQIFEHHIETEGLAKMAKQMGYGVYGMPFVEVVH